MNVILIINDTFRRDHLGCYGNPWIKTPHLDQFATQAAVFEQYYAGSYPTVPNRWDLHTGRYGFPFRGWQPLGPEDVTLAQILAERGVHTQMIWDTPMLGLHDYNYTRGFKGVLFLRGQKGDPWITDPSLPIRMPAQPHKICRVSTLATYLRNHFGQRYEREFCVARTVSAAVDWLETNYTHKSFFLCLDMWDPHEPFDCPEWDYELYGDPAYQGDRMIYPEYGRPTYMNEQELKDVRARYAGKVTLVDRWLGHLFETVEKLGLVRNSLIIWATDHGHLFGDHSLQGKPGAELGTLYEQSIRIPLLVRHPTGLGAGKRINGIVQPPDLFPSILEFLGIPTPQFCQGKSFWSLVTGEEKAIHDLAFSSRFPPSAGDESYTPVEGAAFDGWVGSDRIIEPATITDGEWSYLCAPVGMGSELYNLKADPQQERNVLDQYPDVGQRMHRAWLEFLESHGAPEKRIRPFIDAKEAAHTPKGGELFAFRDDLGQWIAYPTQHEIQEILSYQSQAPGPARAIEQLRFGDFLDDNPRNLIHLYGQYYWAVDLA